MQKMSCEKQGIFFLPYKREFSAKDEIMIKESLIRSMYYKMDRYYGIADGSLVNYSAIELPSFRQKTPRGISWLLLIPTYAGDILWDGCNHPTP